MIDALRDGIRRVNDAPAVLFGVWIALLLHSAWLGQLRPPAPVDSWPAGPFRVADFGYAALLVFLAGGAMDRYARDRPTRSFGFFGASGLFFFRFLRLALIVAPLAFLAVRGFGRGPGSYYAAIGILIGLKFLGEFAAVRMVVEDRRSALGALTGALRFILSTPGRVVFISAATILLFAAVGFIQEIYRPAPGVGPWALFVASLVGVLARTWVLLVGWASQISLFQSRLAHAGYVARPQPAWPESPSAEAITASARSRSSA